MNKPTNKDFLSNLLTTLNEFHNYQLEHTYPSTSVPPYDYDTLGLADWLTYDKGIEVNETKEVI